MKFFLVCLDGNLLSVEDFRMNMDYIKEKVVASIKAMLMVTSYSNHMFYPFPDNNFNSGMVLKMTQFLAQQIGFIVTLVKTKYMRLK